MCSFSIITVISDLARPSVTSITVRWVKTSERDGDVAIVCANSKPGKRRIKSSAGIFLISFLVFVNVNMSNVALGRLGHATTNTGYSAASPLQALRPPLN